MALFVQRSWNELPVILTEGAAVRYNRNRKLLFVFNSEGWVVATFLTELVTECWIEVDGSRLPPPEAAGRPSG
jgi:hypothetical protein